MKPHWNPARRDLPASTVYQTMIDLDLYDLDPDRALCARDVGELALYFWKAFENMVKGCPSEDAWSICVVSLNIALILAEMGYGRECVPELNDALAGAFRAKVRGDASGRWGFDGPAIQSIREAYRTHEAQLEHATRADVALAMATVRERIESGNVYSAEPSL